MIKGKVVRDTEAYRLQTKAVHVKNNTGLRYPRSVQYFITVENEGKLHPTQKPEHVWDNLPVFVGYITIATEPEANGNKLDSSPCDTLEPQIGFNGFPIF